jgi:hypothetical protein
MMTTYLDHQQILVTGPADLQVVECTGARILAGVRKTLTCNGVQAVVDPTLARSTSIAPEVVVAAVAVAAEVTQVAVMFPAAIPCRLLQVYKKGFLLREFSSR